MMLVEALRNHSLIKMLNLSQNNIAAGTCKSLGDLLTQTQELEELYLHWCELDKECGRRILEGLSVNKTLKVFDFSWNKIGNSKETLAKLAASNLPLM